MVLSRARSPRHVRKCCPDPQGIILEENGFETGLKRVAVSRCKPVLWMRPRGEVEFPREKVCIYLHGDLPAMQIPIHMPMHMPASACRDMPTGTCPRPHAHANADTPTYPHAIHHVPEIDMPTVFHPCASHTYLKHVDFMLD